MQEAGINPAAEDDPAWTDFFEAAKEQGLSQDQMNWMIQFGGQWVNDSINAHLAEVGPGMNKEAEIEKLSAEWGDKTETRGKEIMAWAKGNLPRDVLTKPLIQTAAGLKALHQYMTEQRGAQPIPAAGRGASESASDLNDKIESMIASEAYRSGHHPNHKHVHQQVDQLVARMLKQK